MVLKMKYTLAATALFLGLAGWGCTDEEQPVEPVQPTASTEPAPPPVEATPPPAATFAPETVYFAFDDYTLNAEAQGKLGGLADHLKASQGTVVQVEGHCDERGTAEYNLGLGERRASAVKAYLVELGVPADRVVIVSKGKETPFCTEGNEACWQQNRRGHFIITAK